MKKKLREKYLILGDKSRIWEKLDTLEPTLYVLNILILFVRSYLEKTKN